MEARFHRLVLDVGLGHDGKANKPRRLLLDEMLDVEARLEVARQEAMETQLLKELRSTCSPLDTVTDGL
jgi:hypothetical protein